MYKGRVYVLQLVISAARHNIHHHITFRQWCYSNIHTGRCIYNASGRTGVIFDVTWCKHPQSKRAPKSWNDIKLRSWHGNASRFTVNLWGESACYRWIPLKRPVMRIFGVAQTVQPKTYVHSSCIIVVLWLAHIRRHWGIHMIVPMPVNTGRYIT